MGGREEAMSRPRTVVVGGSPVHQAELPGCILERGCSDFLWTPKLDVAAGWFLPRAAGKPCLCQGSCPFLASTVSLLGLLLGTGRGPIAPLAFQDGCHKSMSRAEFPTSGPGAFHSPTPASWSHKQLCWDFSSVCNPRPGMMQKVLPPPGQATARCLGSLF